MAEEEHMYGRGKTALVVKAHASLVVVVVPGKGMFSHSSLTAEEEEGSGR